MNILPAGIKYYSRERIISPEPNITRGDQILLAGTIYYSREWNITRGNVLITRGEEKLLAGTKYYSREYNITRGNELLLAGKNITRGKELLLGGIYLLLAGTIYYSRERNIGSIWHQRASVLYTYSSLLKCCKVIHTSDAFWTIFTLTYDVYHNIYCRNDVNHCPNSWRIFLLI